MFEGIPIPLSFTKNLNFINSSLFSISNTSKSISPFNLVNLIALLIRFDKTCLILIPSLNTQFGISLLILKLKLMFFSSALLEKSSYTFLQTSLIFVSLILISKLPLSIFEISKISFIIDNKDFALSSIIEEYFLAESSISELLANSSEKPIIELRGVLISWLIFAKNVDFTLSEFCAFKRASFKDSVLFSTSFSNVSFICNNSLVFSSTLSSKWSFNSFCVEIKVLISFAISLNELSSSPISSFEVTLIL